ncbi:uncharacterized protein LOC143297676 [Babylonia areolata]|uniref:uncharacterized protein LOC143297676 n=1 Tax=Babylonia areolata TaxID=304850 RepID=UPI003FD67A22
MSVNASPSTGTGESSVGVVGGGRGGADDSPWDTSDPFVSAHTRDLVLTLLKCYMRQVICFLGVPGNVLCCLVFFKQGLTDRINLLLFSLAVADFFNLGTQLLMSVPCYLQALDRVDADNWHTVMLTKVVYINRVASFVSGSLIALVSVDRCLSVTMPLRAGRLLSFRPMLTAIVLISLIHLICYLPSMIIYTVKWKLDPSTNRSVAYSAVADWSIIDSHSSEAFTTVIHLIFKPVCIVVAVVCSSVTIVFLRRASRNRQRMTGSAKEEGAGGGGGEDTKITKMLLFLCICYVILVLPELCVSITYSLVPDFFFFRKYHNTFSIVFEGVIFNASCLNSAINFFAYVLLSSRFKRTLKTMWCCCPQ